MITVGRLYHVHSLFLHWSLCEKLVIELPCIVVNPLSRLNCKRTWRLQNGISRNCLFFKNGCMQWNTEKRRIHWLIWQILPLPELDPSKPRHPFRESDRMMKSANVIVTTFNICINFHFGVQFSPWNDHDDDDQKKIKALHQFVDGIGNLILSLYTTGGILRQSKNTSRGVSEYIKTVTLEIKTWIDLISLLSKPVTYLQRWKTPFKNYLQFNNKN